MRRSIWKAAAASGAAMFLVLVPCAAQLPATAATTATSVSQLPSAQPPGRLVDSHLAVLWDGTALEVEANNASLNAVLHEVGMKTKMRIMGSAPEERIFGTYGPGPVNLVVPALLNGVAVNMLLTEREGGAADELLLTGRNGAATPSYVPTQQDAVERVAPQQPQPQLPQSYRRNDPRLPAGLRNPAASRIPPNGNDPVVPDNGINGRDNGQNGTDNGLNNSNSSVNPANSTDDGLAASPNGVKTPQEIFEQLQRLRQQQTQTQPQ